MPFILEAFCPMFDIDDFSDDLYDKFNNVDINGIMLAEETIDEIDEEIMNLPLEKKQELADRMKETFLNFCNENNLFQGKIIGDCIQSVKNNGYKGN